MKAFKFVHAAYKLGNPKETNCLQEYTIFFPLADNTNKANLATGLDVQAPSYQYAPGDCAYDNNTAITDE